MTAIPERIYLQWYDDDDGTLESLNETTWCVDKINADDVEYMLADLVDGMKEGVAIRIAELEANLTAAEAELDRLKKWVMRTASDDNLEHRAGYHGKRVKREAMAVVCGRTVPVVEKEAYREHIQ